LKVLATHYTFQLFMGTSLGLRLAWVALMGLSNPGDNISYHEVVNRLALLTSFTAYSFVVANWAEAIQWVPLASRRWFQRPFVLFVIENIVFYGFEVIVFILRGIKGGSDSSGASSQEEVTYGDEMTAAAVVFLLHSILFSWYGGNVVVLLYKASLLRDQRVSPTIRNIAGATILCTVMSIIRFITFSWSPMTSGGFFTGTAKDALYPYFFYDIPEWTCSAVLLYVFASSGFKDNMLTRSQSVVNDVVSSNPTDPSSFLGPFPTSSSHSHSVTDDRTLVGSFPRTPSLSLGDHRRPGAPGRPFEESASLSPFGTPDDDDERQGGLRRWLLGMLGNR